jgi:hypothetical protein
MAVVNISRPFTNDNDNPNVVIPLLESSGTPLLSVDFGKPFANVHENSGSINPRVQDRWSSQINYTIIGRFTGDDAFQKAINLADIIKNDPNGSRLVMLPDSTLSELDSVISVAPQAGNGSCLQLEYPKGYTNQVTVQLQLTRVSSSITDPSREISTPTASGNGPIELIANGNTVEIDTDVSVSRSVGRPNDSMTKSLSSFGRYIYKNKVTADRFSLSFQLTDNIQSKLVTITDQIFKQPLGRSGILLDFNGLYNLGQFRVFPEGSAPIRYQRRAGHGDGQINLPTVDLRVIRDTN